MRYYFICNWKMYPSSFGKARALLADYNKFFTPTKKENWINKKIVVCPSAPFFQLFDEKRTHTIKLGSQNIFWKSTGNYTGQISARMAKDFGVEYVIIGHSELRANGDTDILVNLKIKEALKYYITPIVCVGHKDYLRETLNVLNDFSSDEVNKMIFAYEPIEAIGTNNPEDPEKVEKAVRQIKKLIYQRFRKKLFVRMFGLGGNKNNIPKPAILYGGSVNLQNYKKFLSIPDLSGFVVGRESLNPSNIKEIALGFDNSHETR
ncbi:MAG: triose-phosphate isomerase [Patescibacteria group bacterium]|nr:triose-phosphate isomerase [Patescibacteria group bacterium]